MPRIIVGLGNPGRRYLQTRHNVGWMVVDCLAEQLPGAPETELWQGLLRQCGDLWLFKPLTYMNRCGPAVARLRLEAGAALQDLLVVVDDLNLPLGALRMRRGGSSGGHNGLVSLIEALGTEEFPRLRVGIGPFPPHEDARDFVLSPFTEAERESVAQMVQRAAQAARCWAQEGIEAAMNKYNAKATDAPGQAGSAGEEKQREAQS